jgi:Ca2+-binding RTX toxin-like protein
MIPDSERPAMPAPARLVYFGDSFTDGGALFAATSKALAIPFPIVSAGYAGVFSDGPVYAQVAPALLGAPVANYAVGGARAVGSRTLSEFIVANGGTALVRPDATAEDLAFDTNLGAQVGRFLADSAAAGGVAPGTTVSILIGLNDYANFAPSSAAAAPFEAAALVAGVVGATLAAAGAALAAGVDAVVVNTLPSFRSIAAGTLADPQTAALGDQLIAAHNAALATGAAQLRALGLPVRVTEFGAMLDEIAADLPTFGVIAPLGAPVLLGDGGNPTVTAGPDGEIELGFPANPLAALLDPDQFAYFDFFHPSAATHGALGAFQALALSGADVRFFGAGAQTGMGGAGVDALFGGAGDDQLSGRDGDDVAFGGVGDDVARGGRGDDVVSGGAGRDRLFGDAGRDVAAGGRGNDVVQGGCGDDVLIDGLGCDLLCGGRGDDAFLHTDPILIGGAPGARDRFFGGAGFDTLYLALSAPTRAAVEAEIGAAPGAVAAVATLGLTLRSIERVVYVDDRGDLADVAAGARLSEADLWGLV